MAHPVLELFWEELQVRLDEDLLPALYAAASLPTSEIRQQFWRQGVPFVLDHALPPEDLLAASERVVAAAATRGGWASGAGALAGFAGIPPEAVASVVLTLRLAQRLGVVWGHDPETTAGQIMLWRCFAAAWGVELPEQGNLELRVRDLPAVLGRGAPNPTEAAAWVGQRVTRAALVKATRGVTRLVPGLTAGLSLVGGRRRVRAQGDRMVAVLARSYGGGPLDLADEVDAVVVGDGGSRT